MALKRYSKEEFLNLLEDKISEAGSPSNLAKKLQVSNSVISQARYGYDRAPSPRILKELGLTAKTETYYISTGEENVTSSTNMVKAEEEDLPVS